MRKPSLTAALVATGTDLRRDRGLRARRATRRRSPAARAAPRRRSTSRRPRPTTRRRRSTIFAPCAATLTQAPSARRSAPSPRSVNAKAISPDAILPLVGNVIVADATNATLAATAVVCTGTATHAAVWNLSLTAAGQTLNVPVFVDATPGAETALGVTKMQTCLASPDVGRRVRSDVLREAARRRLHRQRRVHAPPRRRSPTWLTLFTPFAPGTATANAGRHGHRSSGSTPSPSVTLAAKVGKGRKVALAGRVTARRPAPAPSVPVVDPLRARRRSPAPRRTAAGHLPRHGKG